MICAYRKGEMEQNKEGRRKEGKEDIGREKNEENEGEEREGNGEFEAIKPTLTNVKRHKFLYFN